MSALRLRRLATPPKADLCEPCFGSARSGHLPKVGGLSRVAHFLLHAAGEQQENGPGASGGRPAILRVASGPMRRGLRIARRHAGQCPGAVVFTGTQPLLQPVFLLLACCTQEEKGSAVPNVTYTDSIGMTLQRRREG